MPMTTIILFFILIFGPKYPQLFKLRGFVLIAPITLFLILIFGPKCAQLFKFKLRELVLFTRIILFLILILDPKCPQLHQSGRRFRFAGKPGIVFISNGGVPASV